MAVFRTVHASLAQALQRAFHVVARIVQRTRPGRPVPLTTLAALRRLAPVTNALAAPTGTGSYTLADESVRFLLDAIDRLRPATVLEFGSGESTSRLARVLSEMGTTPRGPVVFSLEQDEAFAAETARLLDEAGLADLVRLAWRPLVSQLVGSTTTTCYDLTPEFLREFIPREGPGLIIVDGPAGGGEVRLATLPLVQAVLPAGVSVPFFLDDALRDDELAVAKRWTKMPGIELDGIHVVGEGLLAGRIRALPGPDAKDASKSQADEPEATPRLSAARARH